MAPYVGFLAAFLGTVCWIPQAWKAWATRDTSGLSLASNLLFLTTVSLWLLYGLMVMDWPLILANTCAAIAVLTIVAAKLKFK
ncbi:MAG: SemiSWEET family transporter [Paracoccaceae bacterium]